jgi:hypothetical protein
MGLDPSTLRRPLSQAWAIQVRARRKTPKCAPKPGLLRREGLLAMTPTLRGGGYRTWYNAHALVAAVIEIDCMPLGRTKQFFFEKKNQKTFVRLGGAYPAKPKPKQTRVFCFFFFKKEDLSFALKFIFPSRQNIFKMKDSGH